MTEARLTDRLAVKTAAFVLAVLLSVAALAGIGGTAAVLLLAGGQNTPEAAVEHTGEWLLRYQQSSLVDIANTCFYGGDIEELLAEGLYYTVTDGGGTELFSNYHGQPTVASAQSTVYFDGTYSSISDRLTVTAYLPSPATGWTGTLLQLVEGWHRHWGAILASSGVCLLGALLLTVFLLRAAGWRAKQAPGAMRWIGFPLTCIWRCWRYLLCSNGWC